MAKSKYDVLRAKDLAKIAGYLKDHFRWLRGRALTSVDDLQELEALVRLLQQHCEDLAEADDG